MTDQEAQDLLDAWLAKRNAMPGALFGRVLLEKDHYASGANGVVYVYRKGVYVRASLLVKQRIQAEAGSAWSRHIQNEVEAWLIANSPPLDLNALGPHRINLRNGLLIWTRNGWRLCKHSPRYRTTVQYPVTYDAKARCPAYDKFLVSSLPDPQVRRLVDEWMGFCLTPDYAHHKALMATGESGSGKSVYLKVLTALLGKSNVSSLALAEITRDTFGASDLYGKAVNICTDIDSSELRSTGLFKRLVAGEEVRAQEKHKPAFDFRNTAKFAFSANEIPSSRDTTSAFFERWLVVIFPRKFRLTDDEILNLDSLITADDEEMSGILNRALEGYRRLRRQKGFTGCASTEEARLFFRERADGFASWLTELPPGERGRRAREVWYACYKDWCRESGHHALSSTKFYERARKWGTELGVTIRTTRSKGYGYITIEDHGVVGGSSSHES